MRAQAGTGYSAGRCNAVMIAMNGMPVAEGEGFEPPEPRGSTVFKTAAIDHSATPPSASLSGQRRVGATLHLQLTLLSSFCAKQEQDDCPDGSEPGVQNWRLLLAGWALSLVAACSSTPDNMRHYSGGGSAPTRSGSWAPASSDSTRASRPVDARGLIAASSEHQKVGRSYTVAGRTYRPQRDDNYDETGIASWYGPNFHGRPTANGEVFDQHTMTAAHTTLPIPSIAEVTNLENGRSVIVRINDRGPFVDNRLIDLSRAAATELDYIGAGLAHVRVRYLGPAHENGEPPERVYQANAAPTPATRPQPTQVAAAQPATIEPTPAWPPASASGGQFSLQVGAFSDRGNAQEFARRLDGAGDVRIENGASLGGQVWRVFVGRWTDRNAAHAARGTLADWGVYDARIVAVN